MGPRDDIAYIGLAHSIYTGHFALPHPESNFIFAVRMMIYVPIFIFWKLLGISEISACLYFLFCSLTLILSSYLIGNLMYGYWEGIISALIMCFLPIEIVFSSQIMPDVPQSAFFGVATFLFLLGRKKQNILYIILSGIVLALCVMSKEFAVIYFLIMAVFAFYNIGNMNLNFKKSFYFLCILYSASFATLFLWWLPYIIHSIPWSPIKMILHNAQWDKNGNPDTWYYFKIMFNLYDYPWSNRYFGIFYYLVIPSIIIVIGKEYRRAFPILFWFLFYIIFLQWIGPWLANRPTCERMERFLIPLSLPASLIVARALGLMWQRGIILKATATLIVIILCINLLQVTVSYAYPSEYIHLRNLKEVAKLLPDLNKKPIYLDNGSADKMRFLTIYKHDIRGYPPDQKEFTQYSRCWFVFDTSDEAFMRGWIKKRIVPKKWIKVFRIKAPQISHFGNYDTLVFWVP